MPNFRTAANAALGLPDFNPAVVDDTAKIKVGTIAKAFDETQGEGEFIYLPGVASCAEGDFVVYDLVPGSQAIARAVAATHAGKGRPVAVAMAAVVAGKYGWFQISGVAVGNVAASFAAGSMVFLTSTAGTVDDAAVNGAQVLGAHGSSAIGTPDSGQAYITLNRPFVQGQIL